MIYGVMVTHSYYIERLGFESLWMYILLLFFIPKGGYIKMKTNKLTEWFLNAETFTKKHSPEILTGLAIVGVISTAISAYKAGPRAQKILSEKRKDAEYIKKDDKESKRAVVFETIKEMTPVMAPTIITGAATTACILGSHTISSRRIAALSAAYTISERAVKDLNAKMVEVLGEKKARGIKDAIIKDKVGESPKDEKGQPIIFTSNNGDVLCKDLYSGRPFHSNAQKIGRAINELSAEVRTDMYVSLNDFYEKINSPELPKIPLGERLGWNVDDLINGSLPITFTAILTDDQVPCLCVDYDIYLREDFRRLY